jgi:hypothetical protein
MLRCKKSGWLDDGRYGRYKFTAGVPWADSSTASRGAASVDSATRPD